MKKTHPEARFLIQWTLFFIVAASGLTYLFVHLATGSRDSLPLAGLLSNTGFLAVTLIPGLSLQLLHSWWALGYRRGSLLVALAFLAGFLFELAGIHTGLVFGGEYFYGTGNPLTLLGVPLVIPLFWSVFIYAGYWMTTSALVWLGYGKPDHLSSKPWALVPAVCLDVFLVVSIDCLMDPLQVSAGNWAWLKVGSFFGVPPANFLGWMVVTVIVTGIFRTLEYRSPQKTGPLRSSTAIIPAIGYGLLGLGLAAFAATTGLAALAAIGVLVMFPVVVINICLFLRWRTRIIPSARLVEFS